MVDVELVDDSETVEPVVEAELVAQIEFPWTHPEEAPLQPFWDDTFKKIYIY